MAKPIPSRYRTIGRFERYCRRNLAALHEENLEREEARAHWVRVGKRIPPVVYGEWPEPDTRDHSWG